MMFDDQTLQQLYRYGMVLCGDADRAYDLLYDSLSRYLSENIQARHDSAYLRRMMRNRFIDQQRHQQRFPTQSLDEPGLDAIDISFASLEQLLIDQQQLDSLWRQFDPIDREILFLWAVEGYSTTEVAGLLELARGTVLSRIHRLRQRVQTMQPQAGTAGPDRHRQQS